MVNVFVELSRYFQRSYCSEHISDTTLSFSLLYLNSMLYLAWQLWKDASEW